MDIAGQRLRNQHIATAALQNPADVVAWLGALQAQDYLGGLWAVGLRTRSATELDVERALADRTILRTWPMRGTLHCVAASDARWMLDLLARTAGKAVVTITPAFFGRSRAEHLRIASAASVRYGRFLNLPVKVAGQRQPARSGL